MTALTPQQMRARADENAEWAQVVFGLPNREQDARELLLNADMFRGAAERMDYLKNDRDLWHRHAVENERKAERLEAAVENAPHADGCGHVDWSTDGLLRLGQCTCWKADAL